MSDQKSPLHELNNYLFIAQGQAKLLKRDFGEDLPEKAQAKVDKIIENLEKIEKAAAETREYINLLRDLNIISNHEIVNIN